MHARPVLSRYLIHFSLRYVTLAHASYIIYVYTYYIIQIFSNFIAQKMTSYGKDPYRIARIPIALLTQKKTKKRDTHREIGRLD